MGEHGKATIPSRIAIVQRTLPHYRFPTFDALLRAAAPGSLLIHGDVRSMRQPKQTAYAGDVPAGRFAPRPCLRCGPDEPTFLRPPKRASRRRVCAHETGQNIKAVSIISLSGEAIGIVRFPCPHKEFLEEDVSPAISGDMIEQAQVLIRRDSGSGRRQPATLAGVQRFARRRPCGQILFGRGNTRPRQCR